MADRDLLLRIAESLEHAEKTLSENAKTLSEEGNTKKRRREEHMREEHMITGGADDYYFYHILVMETCATKQVLSTYNNGQKTSTPIHILLSQLGGEVVCATEANSGGNCTSRTWTVKTKKPFKSE